MLLLLELLDLLLESLDFLLELLLYPIFSVPLIINVVIVVVIGVVGFIIEVVVGFILQYVYFILDGLDHFHYLSLNIGLDTVCHLYWWFTFFILIIQILYDTSLDALYFRVDLLY